MGMPGNGGRAKHLRYDTSNLSIHLIYRNFVTISNTSTGVFVFSLFGRFDRTERRTFVSGPGSPADQFLSLQPFILEDSLAVREA